MATLAILSNADLEVSVGDHGVPALIESLSDNTENLATGYILKVIWGYYNRDAVVTYPDAGSLVSSTSTQAVVRITGHTDSLGNTVTITQTVDLSGDTIDIETEVTLTAASSENQVKNVDVVNHFSVTLAGTGREAGETALSSANSIASADLGIYPDDLNADLFRDGASYLYLGVRQNARWLGVMGYAMITMRSEGVTGPDNVRIALEPRPIAITLSETRTYRARMIIRDENLTVEQIRSTLQSAMTSWLASLPPPVAEPDDVVNSYAPISEATMRVASVGPYEPAQDADYFVSNYLNSGDTVLLWAPHRVYYQNPEYTSSTVLSLGYDPLGTTLTKLRNGGASTIILRVWPVDEYFVKNPTKTIVRANGNTVNGYYGIPDGYPALYLAAQPDHADMTIYWQNFTELASHYDYDVLSLEEMYYVDWSYGSDDETHYIQWVSDNYGVTVAGFPEVVKPGWYWDEADSSGNIVKFWDEKVIAWRNWCMKQFYARCKSILETYGKRMAIEVRWSGIEGYYREEVEAGVEGGTIDVGWRSVAWYNAYDYTLVPDVADLFIVWFYWDISATDLGGGSYDFTLTPGDFTENYISFLMNQAGLAPERLHIHIAPIYHDQSPWYSYGFSKWSDGLTLLRIMQPCQMSCDLGALPGIKYVASSTSPVSVTNEAVVRGAGDSDALAYWKDVDITRIGDTEGATDYTESTDYTFTDNKVKWVGTAPAAGATYYVTYTAKDYTETYQAMAVADANHRNYLNAWLTFTGHEEV